MTMTLLLKNPTVLLLLPFFVSAFHVSTPSHARARPLLHPTPVKTQLQATLAQEAASAIDSFFQTQPYLSAFLTCSFKASSADLVAQTRADENSEQEDDDNSVDVSRNLAFIVYGGIYQGLFQEFLYSVLFPAWFGTDATFKTVATQVSIDSLLIAPFICLPILYIVKSAFTSDEINMEAVKKTLEKYVEDVRDRGLLFKYWGLWVPVQSLTFSVIPQHFRIAFIACISFFWMFILSITSASTDTVEAKPSSKEVTN